MIFLVGQPILFIMITSAKFTTPKLPTHSDALKIAQQIAGKSTPVINIYSVDHNRRWKRNVKEGDGRTGPWLSANYEVLDKQVWLRREPCLYIVTDASNSLCYVGISRNRLRDRWRESPAYDADTSQKLPKNQLFHSQCWKYIEEESLANPQSTYQVRCISGKKLLDALPEIWQPFSCLVNFSDDEEGIVAFIERWMCYRNLVRWNVAMTG